MMRTVGASAAAAPATAAWLTREVVPAQLRYLTSCMQVSRQLEILFDAYATPIERQVIIHI